MKWLKKVAATPLTTIAKVVDTLQMITNNRTNAPSVRAVNEGLANKANTSDVNTALALKADKSTVDAALDLKANTSDVNTALAGKQATITGAASTIVTANLTANRAVVTSPEGKIGVSNVTSNEIGGLAGLTSNVQEQLNGKASVDAIPSNYKIRAGSITRSIPAGYTYDLFTNADLNTILGVNNVSNLNTIVLAINGDFEAHDNRVDNVSYIASTGSWQIRFGDEASGGTFRFIYLVVYFG